MQHYGMAALWVYDQTIWRFAYIGDRVIGMKGTEIRVHVSTRDRADSVKLLR